MKTVIVVLIFCLAFIVTMVGQEKFSTKTGEINFEASVPSFEEVKAENDNVSAVLETATGNFAALALMKGFRFKVALMEEHFNENYIESSKYPKATFKGKIHDFNFSQLENEKKYVIKGTFNLHGTNKTMEVPSTISKRDGKIWVSTQFILKPEEFNIKIPSIVSKKIADQVNVSAFFELKAQ